MRCIAASIYILNLSLLGCADTASETARDNPVTVEISKWKCQGSYTLSGEDCRKTFGTRRMSGEGHSEPEARQAAMQFMASNPIIDNEDSGINCNILKILELTCDK